MAPADQIVNVRDGAGDAARRGRMSGERSGRSGGGLGPPVPGVPEVALHWDRRYAADERLWGSGPSELARLAVARLTPYAAPRLRILDVGCGYGRDTRYLATELGCRVLGLDASPAAVEAARREHAAALRRSASVQLDAEYVAGDLGSLASDPDRAGPYDVVFCSGVYHLLGPIGRREFAAAVAAATRPGGLLFMSTLSPRDPEHYAKGEPVSGEERSWVHNVYLHFCTAEELTRDFSAFDLLDLEERSYEEPREHGQAHHHTSWFLEGRRR